MTEGKTLLSRRKWLQHFSAAPAAAGLLARPEKAGENSQGGSARNPAGTNTYNIRDFGAKGDGKTLDTAAVQAAIDECHKDQGGTVVVPAGEFIIGTIEMKSNVTLRIAVQGKLVGSADGKQYHAADAIPLNGDDTLRDGNVGLIFAVNAENITIEGPGTIDGQGAQFHSPSRGVLPSSGRGGNDRPYHLLFYRCKNLRVRDILLFNSAYHSVRVIDSDFVCCQGIQIYNRVNINNDGFHFISSRYVHITNCDVQTEDDACALFGSCKNVTVTNSTFSTRWAVFRFGFRTARPENITISNCVIYETYGCPIKMEFGPHSQAQNILFSNLVMHNVTGPISIDLDARRRGGGGDDREDGYVRNIMFQGIRAQVVSNWRQLPDLPFERQYSPGETRQCIVLNCVGDAVLEGVVLSDVQVTYGGGGTAEEASRQVPEVAGEYFQIGTPPAYALYARRVRGLTLSNVRFDVEQPDLRPALVFDQVADVAINGLSAQANQQADCLLRLIGSRDVLVSAARVLTPAAVFLQVEGPVSEGITVDGGDLSKAGAPVIFKAGAAEKAVKLRT
jgi:glycosyl hydrolase family 28